MLDVLAVQLSFRVINVPVLVCVREYLPPQTNQEAPPLGDVDSWREKGLSARSLTQIQPLSKGKSSQSYSTFEHIGLLKC